MNNLNKIIHDTCKQAVKDNVPSEYGMYEMIWDTFWRVAKCQSIEEYSQFYCISGGDKRVRHIGAIGNDDGFESIQIIAAFVAIVARLKQQLDKELDFQQLYELATDELMKMEMSTRTRRIIQKYTAAMLADCLKIRIPKTKEISSFSPDLLVVEWCTKSLNDIPSSALNSKCLDSKLVDKKFRANISDYVLFIDETAPMIKIENRDENLWSTLGPSQLALLGMIMFSIKKRTPLLYHDIATKALARECKNHIDAERTAVRRCFSLLNKYLNHIPKRIIKSERGREMYAPYGIIPYCWIRPAGGETRLVSDWVY